MFARLSHDPENQSAQIGRAHPRPRWAALISGRGSNLAKLLSHLDEIDVRVVVSSDAGAQGLCKAKRAGVPIMLTPTTKSLTGKPKIDWDELSRNLRDRGVTHIVLAGFMKIVPAKFVSEWHNRIVNLHPSILPAYPGLDSIERAHSDKHSVGVTVHIVNELVDAGEILSQRTSVAAELTSKMTLSEAEFFVHVDEQRLLSDVVRRFPYDLKGVRIS